MAEATRTRITGTAWITGDDGEYWLTGEANKATKVVWTGAGAEVVRASVEGAKAPASAPVRPNDMYQPWVLRADMAAVKRSIVRYLQCYERDRDRAPVWMPGWHFSHCAPPEEHGAVMTRGRCRIALGALVRDGLLQRRRDPTGRRYYALTDVGRAAVIPNPAGWTYPSESGPGPGTVRGPDGQ